MALEIYSRYYEPTKDRTVVAVHESDSTFFARFDAVLPGNLLEESEQVLLDRALNWFTTRYIQEYAQQKLDEKVRQFEGMMTEMRSAIEEAKSGTAANKKAVDEAVRELTELISLSMSGAVDE